MSNKEDVPNIEETIRKVLVNQPDKLETSRKYFSWIQAAIGVVAVILSIGINYGINTYRLSNLEEAVSKHEKDVLALQLRQAADSQILTNIEKSLSELKQDVRTLLNK